MAGWGKGHATGRGGPMNGCELVTHGILTAVFCVSEIWGVLRFNLKDAMIFTCSSNLIRFACWDVNGV